MCPQKEDRRIRRTKKLLKNSLAELICEKNFKDITVKDITERADLNRGTFYLHYCDTYDLLNKVEYELIQNFENAIDEYDPSINNHSAYSVICQIFDYINENFKILKIFFINNVSPSFTESFINIIMTKGLEVQKNLHKGMSNKDMEYILTFISYGFIGIIRKWLSEDMKMTKENFALIIDSILYNSLKIPENINQLNKKDCS